MTLFSVKAQSKTGAFVSSLLTLGREGKGGTGMIMGRFLLAPFQGRRLVSQPNEVSRRMGRIERGEASS